MIPLLDAQWSAAPPGVRAFSTLRAGGVSLGPYADEHGGGGLNLGTHVGDDPAAVAANRALLPVAPVWLEQVHGIDVVDAARVQGLALADASFTSEKGIACAVMTADCLPVLFAANDGSVVGAAHAGWRGLAGGVLEATVAAMRAAGAGALQAWLGPAIGPAAFEVGAEVREAFVAQDGNAAAAFVAGAGDKYFADLYQLARLRLAALGGITVSGGGFCTVNETRFYSYRRERVTGRMASLIWRS